MGNLKQWVCPSIAYGLERGRQTQAYRTGRALRRHIDAQHGGKIDQNCPACSEILRKTSPENGLVHNVGRNA